MGFEVCRICLASGIKMFTIENTALQDIYERLTSKQWNTNRRPPTICYVCHALLKRCQKFIVNSKLSEKIFTQIFSYTEMEFTEEMAAMLNSRRLQKLTVCQIETLSINIFRDCDLKEELPSNDERIEPHEAPAVKVEEEICAEPSETTPSETTNGTDENTVNISDDTKLKADTVTLNVSNGTQERIPRFVLKFKLTDAATTHTKCHLKRKSSSEVLSKTPHKCDNFNITYECHVCNKSITEKHKLKKHMKIHTVKYNCNLCDRSFAKENNLKTHMNIHTGSRPYRCEFCKKRFRQLSHLIQHTRTHTGEKPYSCDVCHKTFGQLSHLKQHQRIHTGEKPYECDKCDKAFGQMANLKRHIEIHH